MGFWSWLTGHDEKESDLYANYELVDTVKSEFQRIATVDVQEAQDAINEAIEQVNNVKGMSEYIGSINAAGYNSVFESLTDTIAGFGEQLGAKAESI